MTATARLPMMRMALVDGINPCRPGKVREFDQSTTASQSEVWRMFYRAHKKRNQKLGPAIRTHTLYHSWAWFTPSFAASLAPKKNMLLTRCVKERQSPGFECQTMAGVVKNSIAPRSVCCARLPTTPFVNKVAPLPRIRGRELTFSVLEV